LQEECCGAYNYTDYSRLNDWTKPITDAKVPVSCCKKSDAAENDSPTSITDFADVDACFRGDANYINSQVFGIIAYTKIFTGHERQIAVKIFHIM